MNPWLRRIFWTRPFADRTLCHFLRSRMSLPTLSLAALFPEFDREAVTIRQMPRGGWSTPLADVVMLLKLALCARPKRLMEVGSFRGYSALFLAQHTADDARIVTVDSYPDHGEAYRDTSFAAKIVRRVGESSAELYAADPRGSYDLIFVDADHTYEGVRRDTELVLPLVSPDGYLVWHDYANWGYFDGKNGVPEYLGELSATRPIARVLGSDLAVHSPAWSTEAGRATYERALVQGGGSEVNVDPWQSESVRG